MTEVPRIYPFSYQVIWKEQDRRALNKRQVRLSNRNGGWGREARRNA